MEAKIDKVRLELVTGDITAQGYLDAVVNAANAQLMPGGGVAGAIHRKAGPRLAEACRPWAPIKPGQAVITEGFDLPNPYVIHCLGPVYGRDRPEDVLLADCYRNALSLAERQSLKSIGFPALSTGAFGYPMAEAARVALAKVREQAPALSNVGLIRFVFFREADLEVHEQAWGEIVGGEP